MKRSTAPYKYPRIVRFVDELPKTASGKIKRAELRLRQRRFGNRPLGLTSCQGFQWRFYDDRKHRHGARAGDRPSPRGGADRAAARGLRRAHAQLGRVLRARAQGDAEGRALLLPGERPVAGLHRARQGRAGLGRRRQRVHRLPQRLRRDVHRSREPAGRGGRPAARRARHPLRRADRGLDRRRRGAAPALRPAAVALHELGHRVHDGRDPHRARRDRPRHDPQDRGLLPRAPRRGDGVGLPGARGARRPRRPGQRSLRRGLPARDHGADALGPLQRRAGAGERAEALRGQGRGADHGARDDEHQHRPAGRRLPRGGAPPDRRARRDPDLRRGQDRRDDLARRRDAALRRHARHRDAREGELRRAARRRDRHDRRSWRRSSRTAPCTSTARSTATRW